MEISHNPVEALRRSLPALRIDALIVPMVDAFQSEYIPRSAARLTYLTGFDGSAGTGVFFAAKGIRQLLLTDGRYLLQAAQQTDPAQYEVLDSTAQGLMAAIAQRRPGAQVAVDGWLVTASQWQRWQREARTLGLTLTALAHNPVDAVWPARPSAPASAPVMQPLALAGRTREEKYAPLLVQMQQLQLRAILLCQPDAICWLLNLRAADVAFTPVMLCYALLTRDGACHVFSEARVLAPEIAAELAASRVTLHPLSALASVAQQMAEANLPIGFDPQHTPEGLRAALSAAVPLQEVEDITTLAKACKHPAELAAIRDAHFEDGLALTRFLAWLEAAMRTNQPLDELTVIARLAEFRGRGAHYRGPSFATIAGSGPHGAIIHYRATPASNRALRPGEVLLLDSGGQYDGGTTDVTRTLWLAGPGEQTPPAALRAQFTAVLQGHIALAQARFPHGTSGSQLDVLARQFLWRDGLDYAHGTGHGVGAYLSVHEGPQSISKRANTTPLLPGMILSNEPGYYAAGDYGIRIENLVEVVALPAMAGGETPFYGFSTLTLAPIDRRLIAPEKLSGAERDWLNAYHAQVASALRELLNHEEKEWLDAVTAPL